MMLEKNEMINTKKSETLGGIHVQQKTRYCLAWWSYILAAVVCLLLPGCSSRGARNDVRLSSYTRMSKNIFTGEDLLNTKSSKPRNLIYIDPGHGGRDIGTESQFSIRLQEKHLALETAKLVQFYLRQWGYVTDLTRKFDTFVPLRKRVEMANKASSFLFVSIHYNSAPNKAIRGAEVFYYKDSKNQGRSTESKRLADAILFRLKEDLPTASRGVKHGDFCVIRETIMPAVLVEAAFLSNQKDVTLLSTRAYRQKIAKAIAQGIQEFIQEKTGVIVPGAN